MCQGIPRTVLEVGQRRLRVQVDETSRWMQASEHLTREVTPGAFVIVYAGVAIEQVSAEEAHEQLKFLADLEAQFPDTEFPEASA